MRTFRTSRSIQTANRSLPLLLGLLVCHGAWASDPEPNPGEQENPPHETAPDVVPRSELDAAQARLDQVTQRLVEAYRQLFLRLPEAERPAFLAELISSAQTPPEEQETARPLPHQVRELAYDLATAEVVSARPLGAEFVRTAALGLADPQPAIRTKAAELLAKLDASPILEAVHTALRLEQNPRAAVAILSIVARHPDAGATDLVLHRLQPDSQPREVLIAAIDAMLSLHSARPLSDPESISCTRRAIESLGQDHLTPNGVRLLAALGDIESVRAMIASRNAEISRAAAQSLVSDPQSLDAIVNQARQASALFEIAAEAVRRHQPTAPGFIRVSELPAPSNEKRDELLVKLAGALPPAELLKAASSPMDLTQRERILSTIATPTELEKLAAPEYRTEDRRLLLESLVRTRLQLKNAADALRVIQSLPPDARSDTLVQDEVTALIWLNRLDEAADRATALGTPKAPDVWLSTLERIEAMDHAPAALTLCAELYDSQFTDTQREKLAMLVERFESIHKQPEDPSDPGATISEPHAVAFDQRSDTTGSESHRPALP